MLTQLSTVKTRLAIAPADTSQDAMLTLTIQAVSARFAKLCNREFARTEGTTFEFEACGRELCVPCFPIETVTSFHTKENEADGWQLQDAVDYLIRSRCVISLSLPLSVSSGVLGRVTYTGGYVLPGSVPGQGQTALPTDLEHGAIEQVAYWYQNRDKLGLIRHWPSNGTYMVLSQAPLLYSVQQILRRYERWMI